MLTKPFIVAFAIIGIAVRPSAGATAKQVMDEAYDATIGGGISLKFTLWRAANCPKEGEISRGMTGLGTNRRCFLCICSSRYSSTSGNCMSIACPTTGTGAHPTAVMATWNSANTPSPWKSIREAVPFELYSVDDGYCYATNIDITTGRTMECYAHRLL